MNSNLKEQQLLLLITHNMKEMETELRAHSIVLEAVNEQVIEPQQIGEALTWARSSTAMLDLVAQKYELFETLAASLRPRSVAVPSLPPFAKSEGYSH